MRAFTLFTIVFQSVLTFPAMISVGMHAFLVHFNRFNVVFWKILDYGPPDISQALKSTGITSSGMTGAQEFYFASGGRS